MREWKVRDEGLRGGIGVKDAWMEENDGTVSAGVETLSRETVSSCPLHQIEP